MFLVLSTKSQQFNCKNDLFHNCTDPFTATNLCRTAHQERLDLLTVESVGITPPVPAAVVSVTDCLPRIDDDDIVQFSHLIVASVSSEHFPRVQPKASKHSQLKLISIRLRNLFTICNKSRLPRKS